MDRMDLYLTEFNHINHTKFRLKDIYCLKCKELGNCPCVNPSLKELLSDAQFPCILEQCNFKGVLSDFHEHSKACIFGTITCPFDIELFNDAAAFLAHLPGHENVKKVTLESLKITIELNLEAKKKSEIIMADYKNNYFIIFIKYLDEAVLFEVGKVLIDHSSTSIMTFTVFHQYEKGEIRQQGEILPLVTLFNCGEEHDNSLVLKTSLMNADAKVTIHFSHYETAKVKLNDCPVCFKPLFGDIGLCKNAHAFCISCASKMNACPMCREKMADCKVNLKHILSHHNFPCQNLDDGCLELINLGNRSDHDRVCIFRKLVCPVCKTAFAAHTFCAHFIDKHNTKKNFSIFTWSFTTEYTSAVYLEHRAKVFCITMKYSNSNLYFVAELLNGDEDCAVKCRYEVIVMSINDVHIATVGNVCIPGISSHSLKNNDNSDAAKVASQVGDQASGFLRGDIDTTLNIQSQFNLTPLAAGSFKFGSTYDANQSSLFGLKRPDQPRSSVFAKPQESLLLGTTLDTSNVADTAAKFNSSVYLAPCKKLLFSNIWEVKCKYNIFFNN